MDQYQFDFSVVMAVYNVEEYLREAVESLVHQTIGFSRIQLIMVDDGSKDSSGKICDEYKDKYPDNIVVIHKENGGVSSARNAGLECLKGRYLNFMDSDDRFDHNTFQKVYDFFARFKDTVKVAAVPMKYFGNYSGDHPQNEKFSIGKELIDLKEYPYVTNLSASSTFFLTNAAAGIRFDTKLSSMEDAKYVLTVLLGELKLGLIGDTVYWYRKRTSGAISATESAEHKIEWYSHHLKYFSNWALDTYQKKYGEIPKFVQYEVMYDLQWKLRQESIPDGVLSEEQKTEYKELLLSTACRIEDNIILQQKQIWLDQKMYVLCMKHKSLPEVVKIQKRSLQPSGVGSIRYYDYNGDLELRFGDTNVVTVSTMKTVWEFIEIDTVKKKCVLEGYHVFYGIESDDICPAIVVNGESKQCKKIDRTKKTGLFLGEKVNCIVGFSVEVSLTDSTIVISAAVFIDGVLIIKENCKPGQFFPVCNTYDNSYYIVGKYMVTMSAGNVEIKEKPAWTVITWRECRFLAELWRKDLLGGRKAILGRLFYHFVKPLMRKKLWIISDRIIKADDNGEALFRYLSNNKLRNVRILFAISKKSTDYKRMASLGRCIEPMTFRHKLMHLICDANISSQADFATGNPFRGHHDALRDLLRHQRFVFLQHGITKDDVSDWLNRYDQDISGLVTAANQEYKSFLKGDYGYSRKQIWLTGFPRFDRLYHDEKKWITIMPTWRKSLMTRYNPKTGMWSIGNDFEETKYFRFYNSLLNSEILNKCLEEHGYSLKFFPHPNLQPFIRMFHQDPMVEFLPLNTSYRDVYAYSNMVITDYSSAVFDFAYLRKPVLYCQFDKEEFFSGSHAYTKGYYDYERDGFGEVTYEIDSLINLIIEYVRNDCSLKEEYRHRIDDFFAFDDRDNCKRVVDNILDIV